MESLTHGAISPRREHCVVYRLAETGSSTRSMNILRTHTHTRTNAVSTLSRRVVGELSFQSRQIRERCARARLTNRRSQLPFGGLGALGPRDVQPSIPTHSPTHPRPSLPPSLLPPLASVCRSTLQYATLHPKSALHPSQPKSTKVDQSRPNVDTESFSSARGTPTNPTRPKTAMKRGEGWRRAYDLNPSIVVVCQDKQAQQAPKQA